MDLINMVGTKIRNAREDMDLTQNDMAALIPMNQSNYSKIERGIQEPSMAQLRKICQILKLDPRYLLSLDAENIITTEDMRLLDDIKSLIKKHSKFIKRIKTSLKTGGLYYFIV